MKKEGRKGTGGFAGAKAEGFGMLLTACKALCDCCVQAAFGDGKAQVMREGDRGYCRGKSRGLCHATGHLHSILWLLAAKQAMLLLMLSQVIERARW